MIVPAKLQHRAKRAQQYLHQLLNWIDQLWYNGCKMKMPGSRRAGTCCCICSPFIGKIVFGWNVLTAAGIEYIA